MKNSYVCDTMAVVLWMEKRKRSTLVRNIFDSVENGEVKLNIPAIVLAEVGYLAERKRIETTLADINTIVEKHSNIRIIPLDSEIVNSAFKITDIPELHDRLISATAMLMNQELITNDKVIIDSKFIITIW